MALSLVGCTGETQNPSDPTSPSDSASTKVSLGNAMEYEICDVYLSEKLLPEDTSGFYKYYEASDGNTFFIVEMDITNISDTLYRIWLLGETTLTIAGQDYTADIAVKLEGQNDRFGNGNVEFSSGQSYHVYYLFDVPTDAAGEEAVLTVTSNEASQTHTLTAR